MFRYVLYLLSIVLTVARRDGVPNCRNGLPGHGALNSDLSTYYSISTNTTTFTAGDYVRITIASSSMDAPFKGFMVFVHDEGTKVGEFEPELLERSYTKLAPCDTNVAVTHVNSENRQIQEFIWRAPSILKPSQDNPKKLTIHATMVETASSYFIGSYIIEQAIQDVVPLPPTAPDLSIATPQSLTIDFSGSTFANNGPSIETVQILVDDVIQCEKPLVWLENPSSTTFYENATCVVSNLQPDTLYATSIVSVNALGSSSKGESINFLTPPESASMPKVVLQSALVTEPESVLLNWQLTKNDGDAYIIGYKFEFRVVGSDEEYESQSVLLNSFAATADGPIEQLETELLIRDLHPGKEYEIQIRALTFVGESDASELLQFTTLAALEFVCARECTENGGSCGDGGKCLCGTNGWGDEMKLGPNCDKIAGSACFQDDALCIAWTFYLDDDSQEKIVDFAIHAKTLGWAGILFNAEDKQMKGADTIIGWINDQTGEVVVEDRYSTNTGITPGLDTDQSGEDNIFNIRGLQTQTHSNIQFSRKANSEDKLDIVLSENDEVSLGWAIGEADAFDSHLPRDSSRGTVEITLENASLTIETDSTKTTLILLHGAIMFVAWGILFPAGGLVAILAKRNAFRMGSTLQDEKLSGNGSTGYFKQNVKLFKTHRILQIGGIILTLVGFFIIIGARKFGSSMQSKDNLHTLFGVVLFLGCIFQGIIGAFFHSDSAHLVHRIVGPILFLFAFFKQLPTGIEMISPKLDTSSYLMPLFYVTVISTFIIYIALIFPRLKAFVTQFRSWSMFTAHLNVALEKKFYFIGAAVARNPWRTIKVSTFICLIFASGFSQMEIEKDTELLYSPDDSISKQQRETFLGTYPHFELDVFDIQLVSKTPGDNILTKENLFHFVDIQKALEQIQTDTGTMYEQRCWKYYPTSGCLPLSPTLYWGNNKFEIESDEDLFATVQANLATKHGLGGDIDLDSIFGGIQLENGKIVKIESMKIGYRFYASNKDAIDVQRVAINYMKEFERRLDNEGMQLTYVAAGAKNDELNETIAGDVKLFAFAIISMMAFAVLTLGEADGIRGKSGVAVIGVFNVLLAILGGFGFSMYMGQLFSSTHALLPFVITGIGLDDMYIIVSHVQHEKKSSKLGNAPRMVEKHIHPNSREMESSIRTISLALSAAGPAIFMTSVTDFAAFIMGLLSTTPAIKSFCFYAAACVIIDFVMQITFFLAFVVLDARREAENNLDVLFWVHHDTEIRLSQVSSAVSTVHQGSNTEKHDVEELPSDINKSIVKESKIFKLLYRYFTNGPVKIVVCLVYLALIVGLASQSLKVRSYLDNLGVYHDSSYITKWNLNNEKYYSDTGEIPANVILGKLNYTDMDTQHRIQHLVDTFMTRLESENKPNNWLGDLIESVEKKAPGDIIQHTLNGVTYPVINPALFDQYLFDRLDAAFVGEFLRNVMVVTCEPVIDPKTNVRISNKCDIESSIVIFQLKRGRLSDILIRYFEESQRICPDMGFVGDECVSYVPTSNTAELYIAIPREVAICMGGAVISVAFVSIFTLHKFSAVAIVAWSVAIIDIQTLGFMAILDIPLNIISLVLLILSIGITFDYIGHIVHAYLHSDLESKEARIAAGLSVVGSSVLRSFMSTFFGVVFLGLSRADIFRTMFVVFAIVLSLAALHAFIFVPVLLSIFGPTSFESEFRKAAGEEESETLDDVENSINDSSFKKLDSMNSLGDLENISSGDIRSQNPEMINPRVFYKRIMLCRGVMLLSVIALIVLLATKTFESDVIEQDISIGKEIDSVVVPFSTLEPELSYNLTVSGYLVPDKKTTYMCQGYTVPTDATYQIVAVGAIVENIDVVHHMVLFACGTPYQTEPHECGAMPEGCQEIVASWAVGGNTYKFPEGVGLNVGRGTSVVYVSLQMHYDNYAGTSGIVDNSGLSLTLTRKLHKNHYSNFALGVSPFREPRFSLPPQRPSFHLDAECPSTKAHDPTTNENALTEFIGDEQDYITAVSVFLHMHEFGRSIVVGIADKDDPSKFDKIIFEDKNYNFDFQQTYSIEPFRIYKTDKLIVRCTFNTMSTFSPVYSGDATDNEMCLAFLGVYSRSQAAKSDPTLNSCLSLPYLGGRGA